MATSSKNARVSKVLVGCDHAAVEAKKVVLESLAELGLEAEDVGADGSQSVDYPDYAERVARAVSSGEVQCGILLCGTGMGMAIAANKFSGVRATVVHDVSTARLARAHNDANVLCLGGGLMGDRLLREVVRAWFEASFEGGRHQRRLDKIAALESAGARSR